MSNLNYADGYASGQHDALTWLSEPADPRDWPLVAFDHRVQMRAALVCLAHNLAIAAFGERMFRLGESAAYQACRLDDEYERGHIATRAEQFERSERIWHPGCGRPHDKAEP